MKLSRKETLITFFFKGEYDVAGIERGSFRDKVITNISITWVEDSDEEAPYFDYSLKGYTCRTDGTIDGRQRRPESISLANRHQELYRLLLELAEKTDHQDLIQSIRVRLHLARAKTC